MLADGDLLWIFFFPLAFAYIIHVIFFGGGFVLLLLGFDIW